MKPISPVPFVSLQPVLEESDRLNAHLESYDNRSADYPAWDDFDENEEITFGR
jgi:hypothetical protein